ncbi:MAG: response regulator [Cyclobacteriaceae bacterium]|jgi:CheY-like chemotaxis protein|nr:response regulator [Flammeovirgaceae bacterium]
MSNEQLKHLQERIVESLYALESTLGSRQKIEEIVVEIIDKTPQQFELIEKLLNERKNTEAAAVLHKVKVRYSYLGLDDAHRELSQWEDALHSDQNILNPLVPLVYFNNINMHINETLKQTTYFPQGDPAQGDTLPLAGKTVLVAEDDEVNSMVFELFIKELGADVIVAHDGNEAVNRTLNQRPDMIFMDVHMPFFSGLEAIQQLRAKEVKCPIISLSASTRLNEREQSLAMGANEFLIKPANRVTIRQILMKYLVS